MRAMKCDRCGAYVDIPNGAVASGLVLLHKPSTDLIRGTGYDVDGSWHLCTGCWPAIEEFITTPPIRFKSPTFQPGPGPENGL